MVTKEHSSKLSIQICMAAGARTAHCHRLRRKHARLWTMMGSCALGLRVLSTSSAWQHARAGRTATGCAGSTRGS